MSGVANLEVKNQFVKLKSHLNFRLRNKITMAMVSVVIVTIFTTDYVTTRYSYQALKHQKQQDELVMARNIAAQVDEVLIKAKQTVEVLAKHPSIKSMDSEQMMRELTLVTKVTELIDGIMVLDLSGKIIASDIAEPDTRLLLPDSTYKQFVQPILKTHTSEFSNIYKSKTGDVAVTINVPIFNENELQGVLSGGILLKNHSMGGIEEIRIGKSGYAYIVDVDGNIVVHPQRERLLENLSANPPVQKVLKEGEGVLEFLNQEGIPVLAAFAPVKTTGWGVVVRQPTSESYAYAHQILYFLLLVFFISLAGAIGLGFLLASQLSKPMTILVEGAKKVAEGQLDVQIPVKQKDEIGELSFAFNEMTKKLRKHILELELTHQRMLKTQKQLSHSEKMSAIGQLAAGLAHEIYNPLNVISGFSEYLLGKIPKEDPKRSYLEDISRETVRCQKLVAELLHFSKPKEPEFAPTSMNLLIHETLSLVTHQTKIKNIKVETNLNTKLPIIDLDKDQIKQVLLNLFINACQSMPDGGILSIQSSQMDEQIQIKVTDTGEGIDKKDLENIFNPFFTTKEEGTGLGLALSYSIIEKHRGKVQVTSQLGQGSTFTIQLPLGELYAEHS